jgi:hypothetical protein
MNKEFLKMQKLAGLITENQMKNKLNEENNDFEFTLDSDTETATIKGFGEEYEGTYNSDDLSDDILFIHYFEDEEYHEEGDIPQLFSHLKQHGGITFIDDEEATLTISPNQLEIAKK